MDNKYVRRIDKKGLKSGSGRLLSLDIERRYAMLCGAEYGFGGTKLNQLKYTKDMRRRRLYVGFSSKGFDNGVCCRPL